MKIKQSQRVIYDHNPLIEVLCQVRFERFLPLQQNPPSEFQEKFASKTFPKVHVEQMASLQVVLGGPAAGSAPAPALEPQLIPTIHHFVSEDGNRRVSVSADFFTLSCSKYERWELFKKEFLEAFAAFKGIYPQITLNRVGLRYKDLIQRDAIGLGEVPWRELLAPIVGGAFVADDLFGEPLSKADESGLKQSSQTAVRLDDCELLLQSAVLSSSDNPPKQAFLIDADYYLDTTVLNEIKDLEDALETLHGNADAVFRCCIKEKLHDALGPRPLQ